MTQSKTDTTPRILLLAGDGYSSRVVAHALQEHFGDVPVVLEASRPLTKVIRSRWRIFGFWRGSGQILFRLLVPLLAFHKRDRFAELKASMEATDGWDAPTAHRVSSVNSADAQRIIADYAPSVVVVNGTRIIKEKVLRCAPVFVNMHAGITPAYRGVHGGYWAMVSGDESRFGTTVHFVDPGVDTGDVIAQAYETPTDRDSFVTYPLLQLRAGLPHLVAAVEALLRGEDPRQAATENADAESRQWYHPTIWQYLANGFRHGVW